MSKIPIELDETEANLVRRLINVHIAQLQEQQEEDSTVGEYWRQSMELGKLADHSESLKLYNRFHKLCNGFNVTGI